ncbi:hypothetical protein E2562_018305 [Oryza meyeriana var. granulata]|uniref:Uncharacterized protein n=1 Tax=Oryza meyeriana var. granulata TaxID=110450 RepID=A0A6G1CRD9_9ORYZ|nr:hypothetical protein E2562_018305 [Oryza meyeriana var. granulata]
MKEDVDDQGVIGGPEVGAAQASRVGRFRTQAQRRDQDPTAVPSLPRLAVHHRWERLRNHLNDAGLNVVIVTARRRRRRRPRGSQRQKKIATGNQR